MLNSVSVVGRLVSDIEFKKNKKGQKEGHFTLQVKNPFRSELGHEFFDTFPITAWRGDAEMLNDCAPKGAIMAIRGRLYKEYIQVGDEEYPTIVVMAEVVELLDKHFISRM